ncbi:ferric reductase-like transmembrane domain-containing protein [Parendozoicomonas haliclonae]|uniref:Anthranilate 1,2-dioxygenase electron transfer component n=2 Tax=Parendozoicomonas haliclonae TaxID=1960125 RepID=A0A1X7AMX3_9GAMM|nr:Anthranilate 1,2-dioxygenase electron transfer component [Parendozoicomonas haliclonae]
MNLSGLLAGIAMILCVILAARWPWLDKQLHGLDKGYRLHKWLGITAGIMAVMHWLLNQSEGWVVGFGLLAEPEDGPDEEPVGQLMQWLSQLEELPLARDAGEIGFYALVFLAVVALVKRIPYRWFFLSHRFMVPVFLMLVYHSIAMMPASWWPQLVGLFMLILMVVGVVTSVDILVRKSRRARTVNATVRKLHHYPDSQILQIDLSVQEQWTGHKAGQFAFVTFDPKEGPHPFSLARSWQNDGQLQFMVKGLGDYTRTLPENLKEGQKVSVEGPYGGFNFEDDSPVQVWIAGGVGIVPFKSRLLQLADNPEHKEIHMFYSTQVADPQFEDQLRALATKAGIQLYIVNTSEQPLLDSTAICGLVSRWKDASWWFCGPLTMGTALQKQLASKGVKDKDFHKELFNMR